MKMSGNTIQYFLLIFLVFGNYLPEARQENATEATILVELFSSVTLPCPGESRTGNRWEHRGEILFTGRANIVTLPGDSFRLTKNYSLVVSNASFVHEGSYYCLRESVERTYFLYVTGVFPFSLLPN